MGPQANGRRRPGATKKRRRRLRKKSREAKPRKADARSPNRASRRRPPAQQHVDTHFARRRTRPIVELRQAPFERLIAGLRDSYPARLRKVVEARHVERKLALVVRARRIGLGGALIEVAANELHICIDDRLIRPRRAPIHGRAHDPSKSGDRIAGGDDTADQKDGGAT